MQLPVAVHAPRISLPALPLLLALTLNLILAPHLSTAYGFQTLIHLPEGSEDSLDELLLESQRENTRPRPTQDTPLPPQIPKTLQLTGDQTAEKVTETEAENPLTAEQRHRKTLLAKCLAIYYTRQVDAEVLRPWSIMHGLIGYGEETRIIYRGRRLNATEYLCANGIGDDRRILRVDQGQLKTRVGPGVQGHEAQLLAMLAQANVSAEQPLTVDGQSFQVQDLIETEMRNCRSNTELTFRLLSLSHYLDTEQTWENDQREEWSLGRLLREELTEPVNEGACGGTHRLMALSYALEQRRREQRPIDGDWYRAQKFIDDFHEYTWHFQHRNGSFSTGWFKEKSFSADVEKKLYSTGHILEWLVFSLPKQDLQDPRVTRCVDFILNLMLAAPNYDLAVGPRGHALHALRMYEEKVFEKSDFTKYMNNQRLVKNNPQNAGGGASSKPEGPRVFPAGMRRGIFGRR